MSYKIIFCLLCVAITTACANQKSQSAMEENAVERKTSAKSINNQKAKNSNVQKPELNVDTSRMTVQKSIDCAYQKDERRITLYHQDKSCTVDYMKFDKKRIVAVGLQSSNYCNDTYERIKGRLENAGFSCVTN